MMIKIAIAIGLGIFGLVALCCVSWGMWKLRRRMSTGQISATPEEIPIGDRLPTLADHNLFSSDTTLEERLVVVNARAWKVENRKELKKDVVVTLPTIRARDLKVDGGAKLQCPLCWLDFRDEDYIRQLPQCDHVFHRHCIDPVLDEQTTCPVCSSVLTDSFISSEKLNGRKLHLQQAPLQTIYSTPKTPSWVLVNRPVPLPRTAMVNSSSSSERFEIELNPSHSLDSHGESPLLKHLTGSHAKDWNDVDLEKCIDISFTFGTDIPVEERQQSSHSSTNDKGVDSFSFGISSADAFTFAKFSGELESSSDAAAFRSSLRRSRGKDSSSSSDFNPSTRHSRSTSRSSRSTNSSSDFSFKQIASWDYGHPHLQEVSEDGATDHLPLTRPPDQCSFDVLPVITGSGNHTLRPPQGSKEPLRVGSNRKTYS